MIRLALACRWPTPSQRGPALRWFTRGQRVAALRRFAPWRRADLRMVLWRLLLWCLVAVLPLGALYACGTPPTSGNAHPGATAAGTAPNPAAPGAAARPPCVPTAPNRPAPRPEPALPDLVLPCFDDSGSVHLGQLTGPAVINLWASWCAPCRAELPALQRYAMRAAGSVTVIGVDTMDTRRAGGALIADLGLTFPVLVDERGDLLRRAAVRQALPVTLFVDGQGRVAYTYQAEVLHEARLDQLAQQYLNVSIAPGGAS